MSIENNKSALRKAIERFNKSDLDAYLQLYDDDAVVHGYPGVEAGIESIRYFYQGFFAAFPDLKVTLDEVIADGDKLAARFTTTGTHKGELMGIPPTNTQAQFTGITILRFANGKCVERWSQADFLGLMQQLGAIPAPA